MMHKHGEQQNDWKWNSDQPKQHAFSKRHSSLHFMLGGATRSGSLSSLHAFPYRLATASRREPVDR
jgi:hypothetical protein